jgi:hypothetical protein
MPYNFGGAWVMHGERATQIRYQFDMSADGRYQLTAQAENVRLSTDHGVTFNTVLTVAGAVFRSIAVSGNGRYMLVGAYNERRYLSNNYGVTWTPIAGNSTWWGSAISYTGQHMAITNGYGNTVYVSNNYGALWTPNVLVVGPTGLLDVAVSADGQYMLTGPYNAAGQLQVSANFGVAWNPFGPISLWRKFAVSGNGQYMFATPWFTFWGIYRSINFGAVWNQTLLVDGYEGGIDCSDNGSIVVACHDGGNMIVSLDYGELGSWYLRNDALQEWGTVRIAADGRSGYCCPKNTAVRMRKAQQAYRVKLQWEQAPGETITQSFQAGSIFAANSNVVPSVDDYLMWKAGNDFAGGELATAKGAAVASTDIFIVTSNTPGAETVEYVCIAVTPGQEQLSLIDSDSLIIRTGAIQNFGNYQSGKKYVLPFCSKEITIVNSGIFGGVGVALYLCISDSNPNMLESDNMDAATRTGINDIFLFNNNDAPGTSVVINVQNYINAVAEKEVILKGRITYIAPYNNIYLYYTGNPLRNRVFHIRNTVVAQWYDNNYEDGICRFLIDPATNSFRLEDYNDGDYDDMEGSYIEGVDAVDISATSTYTADFISSLPLGGGVPV